MGRLFLVNLEGKSYSCKHCKTNLALCDDLVSKSFQSRHGKASLFSKVVNVYAGKKEDRMMMTGCTPLPIFTVSNAVLMLDGDMNLLLRRIKSTRKENRCWKGTRFGVQMGTIIRWLKKLNL